MKYNIYLVFVVFAMSSFVLSNPDDGVIDFYIDSESLVEAEGDICLAVTTDDFSNVSFAQIPLIFDQDNLTFSSIENEYFTGMLAVPNQSNGTIRIIFQDQTLENPLEMPDCSKLFDLCFEISGTELTDSSIVIQDILDIPPSFIMQIIDNEGDDLETNVNVGNCNASMDSLFFCLNEPTFEVGEKACFSLTTKSFENIQSFQFSLDYNPDELTFSHTQNFGSELGIVESDFNIVDLGSVRVSWFDFTGLGITTNDCAVIAEVCFDVVEIPAVEPALIVSNNVPNGIEASDINNTILGVGTNCSCILDNTVNLNDIDFQFSPNPVRDILNIEWHSNFSFSILDVKGETLLFQSGNTKIVKVNVNHLPKGIYVLKLQDGNRIATKKFVKL